jgi:hypothetical protein
MNDAVISFLNRSSADHGKVILKAAKVAPTAMSIGNATTSKRNMSLAFSSRCAYIGLCAAGGIASIAHSDRYSLAGTAAGFELLRFTLRTAFAR